jgi:hypothetical protein
MNIAGWGSFGANGMEVSYSKVCEGWTTGTLVFVEHGIWTGNTDVQNWSGMQRRVKFSMVGNWAWSQTGAIVAFVSLSLSLFYLSGGGTFGFIPRLCACHAGALSRIFAWASLYCDLPIYTSQVTWKTGSCHHVQFLLVEVGPGEYFALAGLERLSSLWNSWYYRHEPL